MQRVAPRAEIRRAGDYAVVVDGLATGISDDCATLNTRYRGDGAVVDQAVGRAAGNGDTRAGSATACDNAFIDGDGDVAIAAAAGAYLGVFAGGLGFYLWVYALEGTTPTRVANTITVSPIAAATLASVLVGERIGASLVLGIVAVAAGIWLSSTGAAEIRTRAS